MHCIYILYSPPNNTFYVGYTANIKRRLESHNAGENKSTMNNRPWKLVYCEYFLSKKDALIRERKLKNHGKGLSELKKRFSESIKIAKNN